MAKIKHIVCPSCDKTNRIDDDKLDLRPACGHCKKPIFNGRPVSLHSGNFRKHVNKNEIPVVVDFWAPWCGPCKMMAPAFEQASNALSPHVRFAKLNTEDEQNIATKFNIRSIPTMVIFKKGREVARKSGAMSEADIKTWVGKYI